LALTATLRFMTKGVHAALGAQVCIGTGLEVIVVTAWGARRVKVTRWTWRIVAWATVVKLARGASTLALSIARLAVAITCWAFAAACRTVTKLGAFTIACGTIAHAVTAHMAAGARCATFGGATLTTTTATTIATAASGFGVANTLHHFTASGFGCSRHHVTAWGLADTAPQGLTAHGDGFGLFVSVWAEVGHRHHRHLLFGKDFDVAHETLFIQRHQAHGFTA
jgi:hypothetical protein